MLQAIAIGATVLKILVFSPHPDDDIIGCGGSIAKHVQAGNQVSIAYMTSGDAGSLDYTKKELGEIREKEATKAANKLGVNDLIFLHEPDGYIQNKPDVLIKLVNLIRDMKPDLIYIPHKNDAVQDHQRTYEVVLEATKRASGPWFQECSGTPWATPIVLGYEVWTPIQAPGYKEDISEFIDLKIEALLEHKSQVSSIKYDEAIKGLNRYRGLGFAVDSGQPYGEAFEIIKTKQVY
ncbi:PIG-L family deacetylase [bacterium]|jgi:N-acetylglucosamine malate deacetylase 1|nr:PIG-L family deacetylase [bacterium]MBT5015561.1 PIG-L family deacetylase [bacterium]